MFQAGDAVFGLPSSLDAFASHEWFFYISYNNIQLLVVMCFAHLWAYNVASDDELKD